MATEPYPPKGKKVTKTYRGGPWAKQKTDVRQLDDGTIWPATIQLCRGGRYIGKYVVAEVVQKTRTLKVLQWQAADSPEARAELMRMVRL